MEDKTGSPDRCQSCTAPLGTRFQCQLCASVVCGVCMKARSCCNGKATLVSGTLRFDGSDYQRPRDDARLTGQIERIHKLMIDGNWRTLAEISAATGDPEASISAQLRHLRKERFGSFRMEKEFLERGLYKYRILPPLPVQKDAQGRLL